MSVPVINSYSEGVFLRPNDDIDPNKKSSDPIYSLDWNRYIFSNYQKGNAAIKPEMIARFTKNRKYSEGKQDTGIYRDWIFGKSGDDNRPRIPVVDERTKEVISELRSEDLAEKNLNFDEVFSPLPKYVSNIIGIMKTQEHDIVVNAEDENSGVLREEMKYEAWIREELKPLLAQFNVSMGIPDTSVQQVKPKSLEELEIFENIGAFKLPCEIGLEKALSHTDYISGYEKLIKENIIADLVTIGYSATATYFDVGSGKVKHKWLDVEDVILEDSRERDYSDSTWGGYIEYYTINQLRVETGLNEDELFGIANKYRNNFGNYSNIKQDANEYGRFNYDDNRIPVLHSYWKSVDKEYYTQRIAGNKTITCYEPYRKSNKGVTLKPKIYNKENRKTYCTDIRRMYHGRWIIDFEYVFDYGIVTNTPYNFEKNDVEFPIRMYHTKGKPPIESMIPIEDQIYLTYIKLQSSIAKAAPPGLAIDMNALDNVTWGNKKLHPRDNIKIYTVSGHVFYRLSPKGMPGMNGGGSSPTPIKELSGGLGTAIADGISGIEFLYRQLDVITGIDGLTSANTTPSRNTGKAVSEMAIASTSNTLKPIYSAFIALKEANARCAGWMISANMDAYPKIEDSPYYKVLGAGNLLAIKEAGRYSPSVYGFRIEAKPSAAEKNLMMEAAKAGLAGGKNGVPSLTYSEFSFVVRHLNSGKSIKYIEMWMAKKEHERKAAENAASIQAQKIQGEESRAQEQEKRKSELLKIQAEEDKEVAVIKAKGEEERKSIKLKFKYDMRVAGMQNSLSELNS